MSTVSNCVEAAVSRGLVLGLYCSAVLAAFGSSSTLMWWRLLQSSPHSKITQVLVCHLCFALPQVRTLGETVRLDARTKLLNPKWYEGMLGSGYEGVREIQKRLTNTMGWSATSGMVDNWVYDEANSTFVEDPEMAARLMEANPNSFRKLVATFLEANGRGYWDASEDQLERLRQMYTDGEGKAVYCCT